VKGSKRRPDRPLHFAKGRSKAVKEMRHKKNTGDDDVPGDILKVLGEDSLRILA